MRFTRCAVMALLVVFLFSGCATKVPIPRLIPATYDMSSMRSLALGSTMPYDRALHERSGGSVTDLSGTSPVAVYTGYQLFTERLIASYVTEQLHQSLTESGYFTILPPKQTDIISNTTEELSNQGWLGMLRTSISRLDMHEYVFARKTSDGEFSYHLAQQITLGITYEVLEFESGEVRYRDTIQVQEERVFNLDPEEGAVVFAPYMLPLVQEMALSLVNRIVNDLEPTSAVRHISLMRNKPLAPLVEPAYEAVASGSLGGAYHLFWAEWERSGHIPSLYNAALLAEALGRRTEAIELMELLWKEHGEERALRQLERMHQYLEEYEHARSQY